MKRVLITYPGAFHHAMNRGYDGNDIFAGNQNKVISPGEDSWLGCMPGTGRIVGAIVSPVEDPKVWEVLSV